MTNTMSLGVLQRRQWLVLTAGLWLAPAFAAQHQQRALFGGPADLMLPEQTPAAVANGIWQGLAQMNQQWNAWKPGELSTVNRALAAGRVVTPSPALRGLIQGATAMESLSLGFFNAGIGGLVARWGFHSDVLQPGKRPPAADLNPWRQARPSLRQIEHRGPQLRSSNPRLQLDFGGYAKGVALDWALDRLHLAGVSSALLNLGGNLAAMGPGQARPWRVGLRDPLGSGLMAHIDTQGREAVITSGTYERYRLLDGERCSHVLDPASGQPAQELLSVTVVHPNAALADAAATALLVAGPRHWLAVAHNMGVDQVLLVDRHGRRLATPMLAKRLRWLS